MTYAADALLHADAALLHADAALLAADSVPAAGSLIQSVDWVAVAPPTIVAVAALVLLVADLFLTDARKRLLGWAAVAALAVACLSLLPLVGEDRGTFCLTTDPTLCSYSADTLALVVQFLVLGAALVTALLSLVVVQDADLPRGEFWFLLLSTAAGAALLPASRDLATLVIALEVASLPTFALVTLRQGDRRASEAAVKFFLSSVTATAVTLMGVSFVYAATGSLHLSRVATALPVVDARMTSLAAVGVTLTLVGFAFKTAVVPFHFWVPETYVGAPVPVAAYLSVVGKTVGFGGLILVTILAFPTYATTWGPVLAVLAALTMTVGNVAAMRQRPDTRDSAVRLLAWSSVGQAGYLIVPIAAAAWADAPMRAVGATLAYALMYAAVNLGAFAVVIHVARGARANRLLDHRALYSSHPLLALALAFFLLCLAGLPPGVVGLFAKVAVFGAAVDAGLGWLAVVMAVNVVIGLVYYLRWTALLFQRPEPAPEAAPETEPAAKAAAAEGGGGAVGALVRTPVRARVPLPIAAVVALTATIAVVLSGAPQLILRLVGVGVL
ncbi:NADH-quinone oxidoreductase subunit N [Streptomyces sp. OF3]|uniref:NADH-quinone oxidoreductase subunit N n=1 Tax=Streptomyces alkaliterrae TaxID=2213162 RepID=A0A7W3WQV8_9ACTN|nr:NADH-quinone oxidoreductase subunit N [Streptomyces alkaliterrae]MBB1256625.1 NADH-quinone oxidoreductase subunit N [Streptomyces alkaliterrae]